MLPREAATHKAESYGMKWRQRIHQTIEIRFEVILVVLVGAEIRRLDYHNFGIFRVHFRAFAGSKSIRMESI